MTATVLKVSAMRCFSFRVMPHITYSSLPVHNTKTFVFCFRNVKLLTEEFHYFWRNMLTHCMIFTIYVAVYQFKLFQSSTLHANNRFFHVADRKYLAVFHAGSCGDMFSSLRLTKFCSVIAIPADKCLCHNGKWKVVQIPYTLKMFA